MKVLHLINKQRDDGPGLKNLTRSKLEKDVYFSGYWDISLGEAESLIGGIIYLHEAKAKPSRFGGRVLAAELVRKDEFARAQRIVFKVQTLPAGRGAKWRGADHGMATYGGIIEVDE